MINHDITENPVVVTNVNGLVLAFAEQRPSQLVVAADKQLAETDILRKVLVFLRLIGSAHKVLNGKLGRGNSL